MATLTILALLVALLAIAAGTLYLVGIPREWKQHVIDQLAEKEGENAGLLKEQIGKIPEADQQKAAGIEKGINVLTGGDLKNPLGRLGGS